MLFLNFSYTLLFVGLFVITFLTILNGFLSGRKKLQIDAVLGVLWVALLIIAWWAFGWSTCLLSLVMSFVFAKLCYPLANVLAFKLLGHASSFDGGIIGSRSGLNDVTDLLIAISQRPDIQRVLDQHNQGAEGLKDNYYFLLKHGLGRPLALTRISSPTSLQTLIEMRARDVDPMDIFYRMTQSP